MKISFKVGNFLVESDASNLKEAIEDLTEPVECLLAAKECGICGCADIRLQYRFNKYHFYEAVCDNPECGAVFRFGERNDKKLYPRRNYLVKDGGGSRPNGGWSKDEKDDDGEHDNSHLNEARESQPQSQAQPPSHQSNNADWRNLIVPLGSNKGKRLGDLSPEVILGYVEAYDNKPPTDIRAQLLHKVCKTALKELAAAMAPADDILF